MKKLSLVLVVAMLVSLLAAPALADTTVVAWWGNQARNEGTIAALELYKTQNEGFEFDPQYNAWADYWSKLATSAAGNALPDVLQMDYQYLNQYVESGLLVDLTPYIESGALDVTNVNEGILNSGKVGEGQYAICIGENAPALLYNKTLLDGAGLTVKDNMTIDEFMDLSREVYAKTGVKTNVGYGTDMVFGYIMRGLGKELFADGKLNVTAEEAQNFFNLYETGIKEGWHVTSEVFAETTVGSVEQDPTVYFSSPATQSWCAFFWSNQLTALQAAAPEGMELGITTWPSANPTASNYLKPSQFFSVSRDAKDKDVAASIVNFWTNSVEANEILLAERGIPVSSVVAEAIASQLSPENQKVIAFINNVVSPNCSNVPASDPTGASEFYAFVDELEEQLCYGAITAADAAQMVVDEAASIFGK